MSIKQLITISNQVISDNQEEPTVNARDLHAFLESKQEFANWIKKRIDEYGFIEGADYVKFELSADLKMAESGGDLSEILALQKNQALETTGCGSFGQQGRIEYAITLDMAKELSMVERTAKGKEARQYFIACEKTLKQNTPILDDELRKAIYVLVQEALADALKPKPKPKQPPRLNHNPRFAGWQETIYQWLQTKSYGEEFTLKQIAKEALGLEPHELDRPAEMTIGITLKSLGCRRFPARRNKKKGYFYMVNGREF